MIMICLLLAHTAVTFSAILTSQVKWIVAGEVFYVHQLENKKVILKVSLSCSCDVKFPILKAWLLNLT